MTRHDSSQVKMASADKTDGKEDDPTSATPSSKPPPSVSPSAPLGRKQLPPVPDSATQVSLEKKMADKKATSPGRNHSFGPFFLEYSLLAEYNQLQKQKLPGVYVIPSAKSALFWYGVLFIRQGLYQGGVFKFSLYIPENYPDGDCPRLVFEPPVFHPIIDPTSGELDVKRGFQKWRRNVNHIWQVLLYARRIFYKIDTKSPLNPEAAVLYEQDHELFKSKVGKFVQNSIEHIYDTPSSDDPHAIRFSPLEADVHEEAHKKMLEPKTETPDEGASKNAQTSGLSWMKGVHIFSREDSASA